jgi:hypothetical protein
MDVVPDTVNQRPQRDRRRPTHLQHNGHTQGTPDEPAVRARKSNSTACRQVPPRMNNEGVRYGRYIIVSNRLLLVLTTVS